MVSLPITNTHTLISTMPKDHSSYICKITDHQIGDVRVSTDVTLFVHESFYAARDSKGGVVVNGDFSSHDEFIEELIGNEDKKAFVLVRPIVTDDLNNKNNVQQQGEYTFVFDVNSSASYANFIALYKSIKHDRPHKTYWDKMGTNLKYVGMCGREGKPNGSGKLYYESGSLAYEGEFSNGEPSGGYFLDICGSIKLVALNICNGIPNGKGELFTRDYICKDVKYDKYSRVIFKNHRDAMESLTPFNTAHNIAVSVMGQDEYDYHDLTTEFFALSDNEKFEDLRDDTEDLLESIANHRKEIDELKKLVASQSMCKSVLVHGMWMLAGASVMMFQCVLFECVSQ